VERSKPISELLSLWERSMGASGCKAHHIKKQLNRVTAVAGGCQWNRATDIASEPMKIWLAEQRRGVGRTKSLSVESSNHYLVAVRSFCRWLVERRVLPTDPTAGLSKLNANAARTRQRRALTESEISSLLRATESGPVRFEVAGSERALLYLLAIETGLRAGELRSLSPKSFDLTSKSPAVVVSAGKTKNGDEARLPLRPETVQLLQRHLGSKEPSEFVFRVPRQSAKMLEADLVAAGVPPVDEGGCVVDFHALRVTFITRLNRAGVPIAIAQRLARHSTPLLTFNVYTKLGKEDEDRAIASLPSITQLSDCHTGTVATEPSVDAKAAQRLAALAKAERLPLEILLAAQERQRESAEASSTQTNAASNSSPPTPKKGLQLGQQQGTNLGTLVHLCALRLEAEHRQQGPQPCGKHGKMLVARVGLEPTLPYGKGILSPQRLPIPPPGRANMVAKVAAMVTLGGGTKEDWTLLGRRERALRKKIGDGMP